MNRFFVLIALTVLVCAAASPAKRVVAPVAPPVWTLIWSDEFDGDTIDPAKWVVADRTIKNYDGGVNYYDPQEAYLQDGTLIIRSRPQTGTKGKPAYSSGRVTTKKKFAFLYGKVDVRAKLPGTKGIWPAIWMLPQDGSWPPEIDIMELIGSNPLQVYLSHHWGSKKQDLHSQSSFTGPDFTQDYHVFSVEWEPGTIRWLIDGVERKVATQHIPSKAMYLILNTSVGGDWPGPPDNSTVFPAYMQVDYVRVYQQQKNTR